ncbi:MAG: relaxase domain-containing protein, partial [Candidatus Dormibacteraeota bacterium]|nr:relaxase domain-containing protein [Candidatus Dormibacteraeota bacterium]
MAFSHHKIIIGAGQPAGQAVSYLADAQAKSGDYYSESHRAPMIWAASDQARTRLGLGDSVELWKVERLLQGQHPLSGELLRQYGPNGTMVGAIDVTLSPAPKSVSILWAMAPEKLRRELELMVLQAAGGAMEMLKRLAPLVRERVTNDEGKTEYRHVKANDVVGLEVIHTTARISESKARMPDPQLHVHNLLFADLMENGKLRAIDSFQILRHQVELDGHASANLAMMLQARGFEIERRLVLDRKGRAKRVSWELAGVPPSLIEAMSKRSQEITDLAREYREQTGREAVGPSWDAFVTGKRGSKGQHTPEELQLSWWTEGRVHDFGPEQARELIASAETQARQYEPVGVNSPQAEQFREEILRDLCRTHALVPEQELNGLAMQRAAGLLSPATAERVLAKLFADGDLLRTTTKMVTTLEVLAQEQRAERSLKSLLEQPPSPAVDAEQLQRELDSGEQRKGPFDPEQRAAIALALSGARFVSIAGPAGTGKGYASQAMVNLWKAQGRRVFALSVAGRTTQQAAHDSGAMPMTLDGLQARTEHGILQLQGSDVLYVDEAAQVDHARYANLLETANRAKATVVQVGDDKQLSPVGPGGLWTVFHRLAAQRKLAVELRQVHRTRDPAHAAAWTKLREGRIEEALTWYRDQGQLRLYDRRPELLQGMVADWWERNREGVMIVDTSNAERDSVNRMAQAKRLEAGELGSEALALTNARQLHVGDRVIFDDIHYFRDDGRSVPEKRVENGTIATVLVLRGEAEGGYSLLDSERASAAKNARLNRAVIALHEPAGDRIVTVDARVPVELAYARHAQKSQGMTATTGAVALSAHTGQQELYEMPSRFAETASIHALRADLADLGADVDRLENRQLDLAIEGRSAELPAEAAARQTELARLLADIQSPAEPATIPEGATPWAEVQADLNRAKAQLEARETVSIREIAKEALRHQPKQAIAGKKMDHAAEPASDRQMRASSYETHEPSRWQSQQTALDADRARIERMRQEAIANRPQQAEPPGEIRQAAVEQIQAKLEASKTQPEVPQPMPARTAKESVARDQASRSPREALALYQSMGRVEYAASPELTAVERALAGRHSLLVAQDAAQAERLRSLLKTAEQARQAAEADRSPADTASQPTTTQQEAHTTSEPTVQPRVAEAAELYQERAQSRSQWMQAAPPEERHRAEPSAPERGVVVINDYTDRAALVRGLSTVAEAELVTNQPTNADWIAINPRAREITG